MSATVKSWMNPDEINVAATVVRQCVNARRWRGAKSEHAMADAASALGTSARHVRSLLSGEVFRMACAEYDALLDRAQRDIDRQAAELIALAEQLRQDAACNQQFGASGARSLSPRNGSASSVWRSGSGG